MEEEGAGGVRHGASSSGERRRRGAAKEPTVTSEIGKEAGTRDSKKTCELDTSTPKPTLMLPPHTTSSITRTSDVGESCGVANSGGSTMGYAPPSMSQDSDMIYGTDLSVLSGERTEAGDGAEELGEGKDQVMDQRTRSNIKTKGMKSLEEIRKMWQLLASSGMEGSTSTAGEAKKKVEKKADGAVWKGKERRKRGVG